MTVSAEIGRLLRFHFRDTLKPVKETKERTDVMNEAKNNNLFIRVSEKEKNLIEHNQKVRSFRIRVSPPACFGMYAESRFT